MNSLKYYKTIQTEDEIILTKVTNLFDFAKFSGIKQPYLHKVWKGDLIVSEKQYRRIKSLVNAYINNKQSQTA